MPSIFVPPAEDLVWKVPFEKKTLAAPVAPGHVRVHYRLIHGRVHEEDMFYEYTRTCFDRRFEHDFKLEADGGLDLRKVGMRWNFEKCTVFDMARGEIFEPYDPYYLSAISIAALSNHYCLPIHITEYKNNLTESRKKRRTLTYRIVSLLAHRAQVLSLVAVLTFILITLFFFTLYYLRVPCSTQYHCSAYVQFEEWGLDSVVESVRGRDWKQL